MNDYLRLLKNIMPKVVVQSLAWSVVIAIPLILIFLIVYKPNSEYKTSFAYDSQEFNESLKKFQFKVISPAELAFQAQNAVRKYNKDIIEDKRIKLLEIAEIQNSYLLQVTYYSQSNDNTDEFNNFLTQFLNQHINNFLESYMKTLQDTTKVSRTMRDEVSEFIEKTKKENIIFQIDLGDTKLDYVTDATFNEMVLKILNEKKGYGWIVILNDTLQQNKILLGPNNVFILIIIFVTATIIGTLVGIRQYNLNKK